MITTQARDMAEYLGIDPDSESDLMEIARMAVAAPTPPGWQQIDDPDGSGVFRSQYYRSKQTMELLGVSPSACLLRLPSMPIALAFCAFSVPASPCLPAFLAELG